MTGPTDFDLSDPDSVLDDRLRRGLHQHVDGLEPTTGWDELRGQMVASSNHRPGRRSAVFVLAAAAVVVVLIGTVVARRGSSDVAIVPAAPTTLAAPASTLVGIAHDDLVELNPDGHEIRTIAVGPFRGAPVVSPKDRTVYIERLVVTDPCTSAFVPDDEVIGEILAIPWNGGAPEVVVGHGTQPVLSPDGSRLSYLAGQTETCHVPPKVRVAHVLDLSTRQTTSLGFLSAVVGTIEQVGPTAWSADDTLVVAFTSGHSCPGGASRASCASTYLQGYRLHDGSVDSAPIGTGPTPPEPSPPETGLYGELGDAFQLPLVDAMVTTRDGSLIVATVEDDRTLALRRVTVADGSGSVQDLVRYGPDQLGAGSFLTVGNVVTMSQDPGSDRIALSVRDAEAIADLWQSAIGPPAGLRPIGTAATWPAWVPAG